MHSILSLYLAPQTCLTGAQALRHTSTHTLRHTGTQTWHTDIQTWHTDIQTWHTGTQTWHTGLSIPPPTPAHATQACRLGPPDLAPSLSHCLGETVPLSHCLGETVPLSHCLGETVPLSRRDCPTV